MTFIASTATFIGGSEFIQNYPRVVAATGAVLAVANIALRFITKVPVTL